jgi:cytochrome c5
MRFGIGPAVGAVLVSFLVGTLPAVAHTSSIPAARSASQADDLPDGDGKRILHASCTACHELTEVTKFKGYYTRDDWRDVVKTMIAYGAKVRESDVEVLVDYLTKTLGKR